MTRTLAASVAAFLIGLIFPMVATSGEPSSSDIQLAIIHIAIPFVFALTLFIYCGFAALHSVSRVEDPGDRISWLIFTLGLNVFGSLIYYLTKYQDFRAHGMGGIPHVPKERKHFFYRATPTELQPKPAID